MTWAELAQGDPELAATGERLLTHSGVGAGFLSTVRRDGGPRVHPVSPVLAGGGLWVFIVDLSWKYRDLLRDPRFALHAYPLPEGGEEFYVDGIARPEARAAVIAMVAGGRTPLPFEKLFELTVERALWTKWEGWGTAAPWPAHRKWHARPT